MVLIFFLLLGAVSAVDSNNVSIKEDSNLDDSVSTLSSQNKLEISNEVSISETNIVNSQNDNLDNSSSALSVINSEEDNGDLQASNKEVNDINTSTNELLTAENTQKVPANMAVVSAISNNVNSVFKIKLTDSENGNVISGRTVNLILDGKNLAGKTDENGIAEIIGKPLSKGTYTVTLKFSGTISRYAATTVNRKVSVEGFVPVNMTVVSAISNSANTIFSVRLTDSENGNILSGRTLNFILNGKNLAGKTDENGIAKITTAPLKGTYAVTLKFSGTISRYAATTVTQNVAINGFVPVNMTVVSAVSNSANTIFSVKLTDSENGNVLSGRTVNLILNGKNLAGKTDENGIAKITTAPLKGTYAVTLKFSGTISRYAATTVTQNVAINGFVSVKMTVTSAISDDDKTIFSVKLTDIENGNVLSGRTVNLIFDGKNLAGKTNNDGVAQITAKPLKTGTYTVTLKFAGTASHYAPTTVTQKVSVFKKIPVKMTIVSADIKSDSTVFKVKLTDSETGNVVSGRTVNLVVTGKTLAGITDNNGIAQITARHLEKGVYDITMKFAGTASRYTASAVTQKVGVGVTQISLSQLVTASKNLKSYIESNGDLPSTVTINGISYTTAQYVYLASEAIYHLKTGDKSSVYSKPIEAPASPGKASDLGDLRDYYSVAKRVMEYGDKYNAMPNSVSSDVGNIGYNGLVYAFSRVLTYYGEHSAMPNYVTIKTYSINIPYSNVNAKNTITNLAAYLAASKNCQVNNAQIKALAAKLTSGLTSDLAKATAIYNYVRDQISYSYYYDTKYGAVGTLNAKNGNCVDQSHLLVALYRASNLPARYVHGTCYFTLSGNTYGHVWTQVLIGDTWVVGDPTSTRNSFGNVVNWNTNSYTFKAYYASLPF